MTLDIHSQTTIFTIINFFILYFLLKRFLFKPINKVIVERRREISSNLQEAEENKKKAQQYRLESENRLKDSAREGKALVEKYKMQAEKIREEIIKKAEKEAKEIIDRAEKEVHGQKERAEAELREQVVSLALAVAAKAIERQLDEKEHRRIMDEFIDQVGR